LRSTNPKNDLNQRIATAAKEIAAGMMRDLKAMGFQFSSIADSLYGRAAVL